MNFLISPVIHPSLQVLITFILCSGILKLVNIINVKIFKNYNYYFLNFAIASILISQILCTSLVFGIFKETVIIFSLCLFVLGIINVTFFKEIKTLLNLLFNNNYKLLGFIIFFYFLFLILISLGPPSMADALDYHYGVPLYLLNNSFLPNQDIWMHGSLFGFGELISAIGLYLHTDNFFTFFQLFSLILFFEFLIKKEKDRTKFFFVLIFIISSPIILFLISGPKPLLFPQLLTATVLYMLFKEKKFNKNNLILITILLIGATQFKLSFILSSMIIGLLILIKAFKYDKKIIVNLALITFLICSPKIYYNFTQVQEFQIINVITTLPKTFLELLSVYKDNDFIYPLNLFFPSSLGSITNILGFQIFVLFFLKKISKEFKLVLIIIFLTILIHFIFGQQTPRIYFEFLLWIGVGLCFVDKINFKNKFLTYALFPQFLLVILISIYFSSSMVPSIVNLDYRDKFMRKNSYEYTGIKWVNEQIATKDLVISELRSHALLSHEFIPFENNEKLQETKKYLDYLKLKNPKFFITKRINFNDHFLKDCIGEIYKTSENFNKSTRNPFNRVGKYKIYIYHFNSDKLNYCTSFK